MISQLEANGRAEGQDPARIRFDPPALVLEFVGSFLVSDHRLTFEFAGLVLAVGGTETRIQLYTSRADGTDLAVRFELVCLCRPC